MQAKQKFWTQEDKTAWPKVARGTNFLKLAINMENTTNQFVIIWGFFSDAP